MDEAQNLSPRRKTRVTDDRRGAGWPGFSDAADYFAQRGRTERDPDARERFIETEAFYRSLAAITPGFPANFKPGPRNGNRFANRAEECRTMADCFSDLECRRRLNDIA